MPGIDFLFDGPEQPVTGAYSRMLVLAHGAGAPMDSPFMSDIAARVGALGWSVARFEFPYMARRREDASKRPPDRQPILEETWEKVVELLGPQDRLVIGGKSMGGRIASMIADRMGVAGLVCLGYPFHPPGKPEKTRTAHLAALRTPALICQGTRDPFGTREDVAGYALSPSIEVTWLEDGNHDLAPRKASGRTKEQALDECARAIGTHLASLESDR